MSDVTRFSEPAYYARVNGAVAPVYVPRPLAPTSAPDADFGFARACLVGAGLAFLVTTVAGIALGATWLILVGLLYAALASIPGFLALTNRRKAYRVAIWMGVFMLGLIVGLMLINRHTTNRLS
jgi:hypothetical protein